MNEVEDFFSKLKGRDVYIISARTDDLLYAFAERADAEYMLKKIQELYATDKIYLIITKIKLYEQ